MQINNYDFTENVLLQLCHENCGKKKDLVITDEHVGEIDWAKFVGLAIRHRVVGVVYKRINKIEKVPREVERSLKYIYLGQRERNKLQNQIILELSKELEMCGANYVFLKGAILNSYYYEEGERVSNDVDILTVRSEISKIAEAAKRAGYIQGKVRNGKIVAATLKQIVFNQLNTYETVPFFKKIDKEYISFSEFDVNFRLGNDDTGEATKELLKENHLVDKSKLAIRTMRLEKFFLYLCIHLYREAIMVFKIIKGDDLLLYKFLDIHKVIWKEKSFDWKYLLALANKLNRIQDVYYTLYFTEMLFPNTIDIEKLEMFKTSDELFLNQYRGKDNSKEVYEWNMEFSARMFNETARIKEAKKNIGKEHSRYRKIKNEVNSGSI